MSTTPRDGLSDRPADLRPGPALDAREPSCAAHGSRPVPDYAPAAWDRAVRLFRALGDGPRLALLARLVDGEACVSELAGDEPVSTMSHRLRLLRAEGLVERRRDGRHVYYRLADDHVAGLVLNALEHASEGLPPGGDPA